MSTPAIGASASPRRGPIVLAGLLVLALVVATVALFIADHRSGPPRPGNFGGVLTPTALAPDSAGDYRFTDPNGTADLIESMSNPGGHSLKITAFQDQELVAVQWSMFQAVSGGSGSGADTRWQSLPAAIPAHGMIRLKLTIRRPRYCGAAGSVATAGMIVYTGPHLIRWRSLLSSHTSVVDENSETIVC